MSKKILLCTDAWFPQVNGVVNTYNNTIKVLESQGHQVKVIHPALFKNFSAPLYPEIKLSLVSKKAIKKYITEYQPDYIHIAAEGPIGLKATSACHSLDLPYTTSFHTMFPDYMYKLARVPKSISWYFVKWFHSGSKTVFVPSSYIANLLTERGFKNLKVWTRGIDQTIFSPQPKLQLAANDEPVLLYVGRVSREKNIEEFLDLDIQANKIIVGDGPYRPALERKYPAASFVGYKKGIELAAYFSSADVFVFPSKTDTFGNVVLEALACGVPVAAFPLAGALELIQDPKLGATSENLLEATNMALKTGNGKYCAEYSKNFTWEAATKNFFDNLTSVR